MVLVGEILAGAAAWRSHAEALADRWHVAALTPIVTLEAAEGRLPPEGWTIAAEAEALLAFLDTHDMGRVHLAGWSLGGAIALDLAAAHPDRVRSLTLVEPQVWWVIQALGLAPPGFDEKLESYRRFLVDDVDEQTLADFWVTAGAVAPEEDPREQRGWRLAWANRQAVTFCWTVTHTQDDIDKLDRLTMPVLLVGGTESPSHDLAIIEGLAERIPHAERLTLPGRHTSHIVNQDAFLERLETFMRSAP